MRNNIKNYASDARVDVAVQRIQQILTRAGARRLMFEYADSGRLSSIAFSIVTLRGEIPISLPARVEKVGRAMYGTQDLSESQRQQAERTAWKNIQDWIDSLLALVETEMVKLEEVFLPYVTARDGKTLFEKMEEQGFLLPSGGHG